MGLSYDSYFSICSRLLHLCVFVFVCALSYLHPGACSDDVHMRASSTAAYKLKYLKLY